MRLMDPPRRYSVSQLPSFATARPSQPAGRSRGREPTITEMMDRLVDGLGLNRRKLKAAFDMAKEMDQIDEILDDAPPRCRPRRKKP